MDIKMDRTESNLVYVVIGVNTMQYYIANSFQNFPEMRVLGVFSEKRDAELIAKSERSIGTKIFIHETEYNKLQSIGQSVRKN